ncbi:MAG TPA: hypothetical protein VFJ43_08800 [Bacteroidia bacterium]|nr:hypothetical protein [Bacteroidia bacterium]
MKNFSLQLWTIALLGLFSGGAIVILLILVPSWQTMQPDAFMDWVGNFGSRLGFTMVPMEMIPFLLSIICFFVARKNNQAGKNLWLAIIISNVIILAMLFVYFIPVNLSFIHKTFPSENVADELMKWKMIHAARTALTVMNFVLGIFAVKKSLKNQAV